MNDVISMVSENFGMEVFWIMHISPKWMRSLMFIVVQGSSKMRRLKIDSNVGLEIIS